MAELYIRGKDGRPRLIGKTADPELPGRVAALENRMERIEAAPGGVPLSDAVNSDSGTTAASSKAVKTAYDKGVAAASAASAAQSAANGAKTAADAARDTADAAKTAAATAQTKANSAHTEATRAASTTQAGRVQLSDAVNSAVSTTAATSKAAKTAYDKAVAAAGAASAATFPKGTKLLFHQAAAPTGWVKQTAVNDATLRVVSGATGGGTGGSLAFSTLFAAGKAVTLSGNVGATTLTANQGPKHYHRMAVLKGTPDLTMLRFYANTAWGAPQDTTLPTDETLYDPRFTGLVTHYSGGSQSHTHTLSGAATIALNVKYADVIICAKA